MCPNRRAHRGCMKYGLDPEGRLCPADPEYRCRRFALPDILSHEIHAWLTVAHADTPGRDSERHSGGAYPSAGLAIARAWPATKTCRTDPARSALRGVEKAYALRRNRWVIGGLTGMLLFTIGSLVWFGLVESYRFPMPRGIGDGDKVPTWRASDYSPSSRVGLFGPGRRLVALLCIGALVLECVKLLLPMRKASFGYALASGAGIGLGLLAAFALLALARVVIRSSPRQGLGKTGRGQTAHKREQL